MNEETFTLDKLIARLEKLRAEHGGAIKVTAYNEIGSTGNVESEPYVYMDSGFNGREKKVFIDAL